MILTAFFSTFPDLLPDDRSGKWMDLGHQLGRPQTMSSAIERSSLTTAWIAQFRREHVHLAHAFLRMLRLVPLAEFEEGIIEGIRTVCDRTNGKIALFAVDKDPDGQSRMASSAGKIGYTLTNQERFDPRRIRVNPSLESMREERIKHLILIDDLIGTGSRVNKFWNRWASKSLKSWLSYQKCKIWVVAFAGHEQGIERILKRITYLDHESFILALPVISDPPFADKVLRLCDHYGRMTAKDRAARGVGGLMSHIIFQHGCPNNTPSFLWSRGSNWRPLFPNRAIPPELHRCFNDSDEESRHPESLWGVGQYRLALNLLEAKHEGARARSRLALLTVLGLLAKRLPPARLSEFMTISQSQIRSVLERLRRAGLTDSDSKLTSFGYDLLGRVRNDGSNLPVGRSSDEALQFYYPVQYFGVQRASSNEPEQDP